MAVALHCFACFVLAEFFFTPGFYCCPCSLHFQSIVFLCCHFTSFFINMANFSDFSRFFLSLQPIDGIFLIHWSSRLQTFAVSSQAACCCCLLKMAGVAHLAGLHSGQNNQSLSKNYEVFWPSKAVKICFKCIKFLFKYQFLSFPTNKLTFFCNLDQISLI